MAKVEEMKTQRVQLLNDIRASIQADDITKRILAAEENDLENVFDSELQKHNNSIQLLDQNMTAQEKITAAVVSTVEKLAGVRVYLRQHSAM